MHSVLEIYSDQPGVQFYTGGRLSTDIASEVLSIKKLNN